MWAMMVAGFGLCWHLERDGTTGASRAAMVLHQENEKLRVELRKARLTVFAVDWTRVQAQTRDGRQTERPNDRRKLSDE